MVSKAVLMKSGLVSLTTAKLVNTAQTRTLVNSARPMTNVNTAKPKAVPIAVKGNQGTCLILLTLKKLMEDMLPLEVTTKDGKSQAELTDESHVLLKVPRKNNMYSVDLKNIVPKGALGFMRPFRYPVTILNTLDHLGKFDGKDDEGFFVGKWTKLVFDIDALTMSMNYKPVVARNQSNCNAGTKACDDAGKDRMETSSLNARFKPLGDDEKKVTEEPGKKGGNPSEDGEKLREYLWRTKRKDTQIPQSSGPIDIVVDEAVNEEMDDSLERAATTVTSLYTEQDREHKDYSSTRDYKFETESQEFREEMRVKNSQAQKIIQDDIDKDAKIQLVDETQGRYGDDLMFDTNVLYDEEVVVRQDMAEKEINMAKKKVSTIDPVTTAGEVVTTASVEVSTTTTILVSAAPSTTTIPVSDAPTTSTTTTVITKVEIILAQALAELKTTKPKVKGIIFKEPVESTTTTTIPLQKPLHDKGKAKMIEPEKPLKKKEQIRLDEELAFKLQAEEEEEEARLTREKGQQVEEANIPWDNVQLSWTGSVFPTSLSGAANEWFTKECISTITTWENLVEKFVQKFYHLFDHIEEEEADEDYDPHTFDNVLEIFKIEDDLFNFDSPLCVAFEAFNYLLKIDPDLFTYNIQEFKTYDEYEQELNNKTQGPEEPWSENGVPCQLCDHICEPCHFKNRKTKWPTCSSDIDGFCNGKDLPGMVRVGTMTYFQYHKWYDELTNGKLKDETLALKAKIEGPWGDATLGVMKFCIWLKKYFENFHELETNRASNVGDTQEDQGRKEVKEDPTPK
ncbi:hypothetical protein Tco_1457194 [Tanacetum coccineum]